jgi:hypothetical protein
MNRRRKAKRKQNGLEYKKWMECVRAEEAEFDGNSAT